MPPPETRFSNSEFASEPGATWMPYSWLPETEVAPDQHPVATVEEEPVPFPSRRLSTTATVPGAESSMMIPRTLPYD